MTTFTIEKLPDEPIIVVWLSEDWNEESGSSRVVQQLRELLDSSEEKVFYIGDVRNLRYTISELIQSAQVISKLLKHPNIIESMMVVEGNPLIKLATEGLKTDVFGNVPVSVYETVDEALTCARAKIAEMQSG
jgi:hypothetical protein